jgi:hypothetical protein
VSTGHLKSTAAHQAIAQIMCSSLVKSSHQKHGTKLQLRVPVVEPRHFSIRGDVHSSQCSTCTKQSGFSCVRHSQGSVVPWRKTSLNSKTVHVGFVAYKVARGGYPSQYFRFPLPGSLHHCSKLYRQTAVCEPQIICGLSSTQHRLGYKLVRVLSEITIPRLP